MDTFANMLFPLNMYIVYLNDPGVAEIQSFIHRTESFVSKGKKSSDPKFTKMLSSYIQNGLCTKLNSELIVLFFSPKKSYFKFTLLYATTVVKRNFNNKWEYVLKGTL